MTTPFINRAHAKDVLPDDAAIAAELEAAGIPLMPGITETFRKLLSKEVSTTSIGELHGWGFYRMWSYWVAEGPGIPFDVARSLHGLGFGIRAEGHCGDPHPFDQFKGLGCGHYHIDTAEGLFALANAIKFTVKRSEEQHRQDPVCFSCAGSKLCWGARGFGPWDCPDCAGK